MAKYLLYASLVFLVAACSGSPPATDAPASKPAAAPAAPPTAVPAAQIAAAQRLPGRLAEAWRWVDANGENLLVVYLTNEWWDVPLDPRARADQASRVVYDANGDTVTITGYQEYQQQLLARQYVRAPGQPYTELWHLRDEVRHCAFSLFLKLLPHTTAVTDLDHDGQTETTLLYALGCRSDVSPDNLKLIMHEGATKYALRGYTVVQFDSVPARQRQPANPCCLDKLTKQQQQKLYDSPIAAFAGRYFNENDFTQRPEFLRFARQHWQRYSALNATDQLE